MKNPLFSISIAFLTGIIASSLLPLQFISFKLLFSLALIVLVLVLIFFKNRLLSSVLLCILIFISGAIRFIDFNVLPKDNINFFIKEKPETMLLRGTILSDPVFKRRYRYYPELEFVLYVHAIKQSSWTRASGRVLVRSYFGGTKTFECGDEVFLKGKVSLPKSGKNTDNFDYRAYLAAKKIFAVSSGNKRDFIEKVGSVQSPLFRLRRFLYSIKGKARDLILINLELPHSGILTAMLLGERQFLDKTTRDVFRRTGTMHILAISGLHIGIIVFIFLGIFTLFGIPLKVECALTIVIIILYALMVGQRPSVWRASFMASVFLFGYILNRHPNLLNLLSFALLALLLVNPNYIFDVGFILSFTCVASIIWISPVLDRLFKLRDFGLIVKKRKVRFIAIRKLWLYFMKSISISLSVWIGIVPIIAYYFHIITPVTIIANLVAVPICFLLVSLGIAALIVNAFLPSISVFFYEAIWLANNIMILVLNLLSKVPFASIEINNFIPFWIFVYCVVLLGIIVLVRRMSSLPLE
ncbi:MAG: ComEC family competence protein [Candidatus Omnitrophica bacterium]|nr:ComEC family competence protein [Candidatus Omnitrophota bacterium]